MSEIHLVVGVATVVVSFLFWIRERQRARVRREQSEQLETKGYVPLGPDQGVLPRAVDAAERIWKTSGATLIPIVVLVAGAAYVFSEPRSRWTVIAVILLCAGFYLLWRIKAEMERVSPPGGDGGDSP